MKKIISAIILTFMLSGILAGCADYSDKTEGGNGNSLGGGESAEGTNGGNEAGKTETSLEDNNTDAPESGEGGTEDDKNAPEDNESGALGEDNNASGKEENTGDTESGEDGAEDENCKASNEKENNDESQQTPPAPAVGTAVGDLFADLTLEVINGGGYVNTNDYRGKIVILNLWATWCPYCLMELPDFERIAEDYSDEVVVIAAHSYSGRANAPDYVNDNFPESEIIFAYDTSDSAAFLAAGGTRYYPRTIIIDANGIITYGQDGMMSYDRLLSLIEQAK